MKVLLVGEETPFVTRLCDRLGRVESLEWSKSARSLSEALSALDDLRPGLVLMDLELLGRSGISLLEAAGRLAPRPVTVVLTAGTDYATRRRCAEAGADHFFTKLLPLSELESLLRRISRPGREVSGVGVRLEPVRTIPPVSRTASGTWRFWKPDPSTPAPSAS